MATPKHLLRCHRNPAYLNWIRARPCISCGNDNIYGKNEAAHVRMGNGGGIGLKPSDYRTVPLCHGCHAEQHQVGEASFWKTMQLDPDEEIAGLLLRYVKDTRAVVEALEAVAEAEKHNEGGT